MFKIKKQLCKIPREKIETLMGMYFLFPACCEAFDNAVQPSSVSSVFYVTRRVRNLQLKKENDILGNLARLCFVTQLAHANNK